jgi:hypothetical protein
LLTFSSHFNKDIRYYIEQKKKALSALKKSSASGKDAVCGSFLKLFLKVVACFLFFVFVCLFVFVFVFNISNSAIIKKKNFETLLWISELCVI